MYISRRAAQVRNVSASLVNGGITDNSADCPSGDLAVIINTLLVTYIHTVIIAVDRVMISNATSKQIAF